MMKEKNNDAFAMHEPSLFVLQSPFQIFCAAAAIRHFEITEYEVLLVLPDEEVRNHQALSVIEKLGIHYKIVNGARISNRYRLMLPFEIDGKYRRAFLGFFAFEDGYYHCLKHLKHGGSLVLLDDGNITITLLKKGFSPRGRERFIYKYYSWLLTLRGVSKNNLFTVYDGISNPRWHIEINDLSILNNKKGDTNQKNVFIVGTNSMSYYPSLRGGEEEYKNMLNMNLNQIREKYHDETIIYIPHGREISNYPSEYCSKYAIRYQKLDMNIELYMLDQVTPPKAIYGYTSSALFNLKKIFPQTEVVNIMPEENESPLYEEMKDISDYYETQGIKTFAYKTKKDETN